MARSRTGRSTLLTSGSSPVKRASATPVPQTSKWRGKLLFGFEVKVDTNGLGLRRPWTPRLVLSLATGSRDQAVTEPLPLYPSD